MAHGFMQGLIEAQQLDWTVDSAGTNGYHDGEHPDPRAIQEMKSHGLDISKQVSRKIQKQDLETFDLILTMDHENLGYVKNLARIWMFPIRFICCWSFLAIKKRKRFRTHIMTIGLKRQEN